MADEKLNPGQGEQIKLDISGESPGPDLTGEGPPAPEPGDVVVATSKIDELMAKRRAAARETKTLFQRRRKTYTSPQI
ncbi:hypothetical protein AALD01_19955 [Oscillospiraceae bacterium 21-37]